MTFGVTPEGFNRKQLTDILSDLTAAQRAVFGALLDTSTETELGQLNGTFASALAEVWELSEAAYHAFDPNAAADYALTVLAALTGTGRRAATASTFNTRTSNALRVNLNAGASCPAGSIVRHATRPDITFTIDAPGVTNTTGSAADFLVNATCTKTGPTGAIANSINIIVTPASGWNSVNNDHDATLGRNVDDDIILRQRREDELALRGGSTVRAIRADLLDSVNHPELAGIRQVDVLENTTDSVDANGLAPHSFEAVLDDGDVPSVLDNDIAQAIWDSKPAGIPSGGSVTAEAVDETGTPQIVKFSRFALEPVYFSLTLATNSDFPADGVAQVKAELVAKGATLRGGDSVIALAFKAVPLTVAGVTDVTVFTLGFAPAPVGTANLTVGVRARATFDSTHITVA